MGPPCGCLARHHCVVWGRWGICHACHNRGGMPHCNVNRPFGSPSSRKCSTSRPSTCAPSSSWISLEACLLSKVEGDGGGTQRRWKTRDTTSSFTTTRFTQSNSAYSCCSAVSALIVVQVWAHTSLGLGIMRAGKIFRYGDRPLEHLKKKAQENVIHVGATPKRGDPLPRLDANMQPKRTKDGTIGVLSRCVDFESISPTQGAMDQGALIVGPYPQPKRPHTGPCAQHKGPHKVCGLSVVFIV